MDVPWWRAFDLVTRVVSWNLTGEESSLLDVSIRIGQLFS